METQQTSEQPEPAVSCSDGLGRSVAVWQVVEWVEHGKEYREQNIYVLATTALEAAEIVGEDEMRQIRTVHQLCPISQLPTDKYRAMLVAHKRRGGVVGVERPTDRLQ